MGVDMFVSQADLRLEPGYGVPFIMMTSSDATLDQGCRATQRLQRVGNVSHAVPSDRALTLMSALKAP